MADVFISYKSEDRARVSLVARSLQAEGFDVWWDPALRGGDTYDERIEQELRDASVVVVLWSRQSVASRWVRSEATVADRAGKLVPATLEPCDRPVAFELAQTAVLDDWEGNRDAPEWRRFVADVRAHRDGYVPPPAPPAAPPIPWTRRPATWAALGVVSVVALVGLIFVIVSIWASVQSVGRAYDVMEGIRIEQGPGDLSRYIGRWSRSDPRTCREPTVVTVDNGMILVFTEADGRRFEHGVQAVSMSGIRKTMRMHPLDEMAPYELWLTDDDDTLHLKLDGMTLSDVDRSEQVWTRCQL